MPNRRMFSLKIVDTDAFLEMPQTSQLLYFHLCMRADDDGFVSNPKKISKMISSGDDDMKVLTIKRFIIPFESGVIVIKHWRMHNLIRSDRYTETNYLKEKSKLTIKKNGSYTEINKTKQDVIPNGNQMATQDRLGKDRLGKDSKISSKEDTAKPTSYGNEDINKVISFLKEKLGGSPDGTIKQNRQFANLLLKRIKKEYPDKDAPDVICSLIEIAMKDQFHAKNATSFKYLYYNFQKIVQSFKGNKNKVVVI